MRNLTGTLHNSDKALLPILAKFWNVNIQKMDTGEIVDALSDAMLEPERIERIWDSLEDGWRGALQTLMGSGRKMPTHMFTRLFGEIRKMGSGGIEREKPHEQPASIAEALYYRGLIAEGYDKVGTGTGAVIYVPDDLAALLPTYKTGYGDIEPGEEIEEVEAGIEPLADVDNIRQADTSIVDDLTTLLAYLQIHSATLEGEVLSQFDRDAITPYLLRPEPLRLAFALGVGLSADLIEIQEGKAYTKRAETRRWLSGRRAEQLKTLVEAWRSSTIYRDLWQVPGLRPEPTGWTYDPAGAREAVLRFIGEYVPKHEWWSLDDFIVTLKETNPDFQRPGGDYESWYIRNDKGEYLRGFESWDAVEGALLEFYLLGPMHWLGLVDLAEDAARLTAYGRAFTGDAAWPNPPEAEDKIIVESDGTLLASRKVPRIDRFQLARFTTWGAIPAAASDPYRYKLDTRSIQQAAEQGINTGHIAAFINRMLDDAPLPPAIARLLAAWQAGPTTSVSLEQLLVLRTTAPETLDAIWDNPALRRYLGARLGPMAVIVRADQWEGLRDALGEKGIQVELLNK